jgi:hypothetical protein
MKMTTITHKKREYKVIELTPVAMFPNIEKSNPAIEYCFIAEGKKGALIDGYILKGGQIIVC